MNRASKDFAWTRKRGGSPQRANRVSARKGRARAEFLPVPAATLLICASILLASARLATPTHSPASALNSFQGAGHFSKLEKQMEDNYEVFLDLLNDKQRQINDLKLKQGQLPGVMR